MAPPNGKEQITASQFMAAAGQFLDEEKVLLLGTWVEATLTARRDIFKKALEDVRRDLEGLPARTAAPSGASSQAAYGAVTVVHTEVPPPGLSVAKLILFYVKAHPGAEAADIVDFARKHKPGLAGRQVYSQLYRLRTGPKLLDQRGDKPNLRYFLRQQETSPQM